MVDTSRLHISRAAALGVGSGLLERTGKEYWPSPAIESMSRFAWPLLGSLLRAPEMDWQNLWMASLLMSHVVVRCEDSGKYVYCFFATKCFICVWALGPVPHSGESCVAVAGRFDDAAEQSIAPLPRFTCIDYITQLLRNIPAPRWCCSFNRSAHSAGPVSGHCDHV